MAGAFEPTAFSSAFYIGSVPTQSNLHGRRIRGRKPRFEIEAEQAEEELVKVVHSAWKQIEEGLLLKRRPRYE